MNTEKSKCKVSLFQLGDIVIHKTLGYRAIIVDIDPLFQASGHYNPQAIKRGFGERLPWCRVLIDQSQQESYVEECQLILDDSEHAVLNPKIDEYFIKRQGRFYPKHKMH